MMELMVAPRPIFDRYKEVKGYYLSFQIGNALIDGAKSFALENSMASPFFEFVNKTGLAALTGNKMVFIPVTNVLLATDLEKACQVDRGKIALLLNKRIELSDANLYRIARFREMGFRIAFKSYWNINALEPFYPYVDYLFCGNEASDIMPVIAAIRSSGYPIKVIASHVDSNSIFNIVSSFNVELLEGRFYKETIVNKNNKVSPLKVNYLNLLNEVSQEDFDLKKFAGIVQQDTALAVQFLKMVNSTSVRSNTINSLRHAAALLGQKEIKKWVTTAVTSSLGQESPSELTRLSMLRAKFCENLASLFEMAIHKENLFLMGLFSVLDVILEKPIQEALNMLIVPDSIKEALISNTDGSDFGKVYQFVKNYEQSYWTEVSRVALMNKISISDIYSAYYDAIAWYGRMLSASVNAEEIAAEM